VHVLVLKLREIKSFTKVCVSCHVTTYRDKPLLNEKFKFDFSESVP